MFDINVYSEECDFVVQELVVDGGNVALILSLAANV